jgi:hypothetical protein
LRISLTLWRRLLYAVSDFCFSDRRVAFSCSSVDIRDCKDDISVPFASNESESLCACAVPFYNQHHTRTVRTGHTTCESFSAGVSDEMLTLPMLPTRLLVADDVLSVLVRGFSLLVFTSAVVSSSIAAAGVVSSASKHGSAPLNWDTEEATDLLPTSLLRSSFEDAILSTWGTCPLPVWDHG